MKILFEGHKYKSTSLEYILGERYYRPQDNIYSVIDTVGYYFNSRNNEAIFVFPKVFVYNNGKAFGKFLPEDIINCSPEVMDSLKAHGKDKILFELSVWMYQAIELFNKRNSRNNISENENINNVISNIDESIKTELDIVLSLIRFHKDNKFLFTQIVKLNHSQQNKIHWTKTISKKLPVICNDIPIYMNTISQRKSFNPDEELIIIFYSTLNYLKQKYSFGISINENYTLIQKRQFEKLLSKGTKILKSIKYKYYSDKLLYLWRLLYSFFEHSGQVKSGKKFEEVLMVRNFNIVFEDMIDDLIGDSNILPYLKKHKDGKQIDHIYRYSSLILDDDIYFVGDSKYYKPGNKINTESIAKQYTYAKNVIQYNIDLFNNGKLNNKIRYRDPLTEGYNITPNFFISAFVDDNFDFSIDSLEEESSFYPMNYHFKDRIFDRDSLLLQAYNINFLFVLSAYISKNKSVKENFKNKARTRFRTRMIEYFSAEFRFYKIIPKIDIDTFVTKYFRLLNGKMYRPSHMEDAFILGVSKDYNLNLLDQIKHDTEKINEFTLI